MSEIQYTPQSDVTGLTGHSPAETKETDDGSKKPLAIGGEAHLPFGGIKGTGVGTREMGPTAIDFFTELKTVFVNYSAGAGRKAKRRRKTK